ncbi:hypothetical protein J437_LFUL012727 [Ladona fulva]|uniref:Uncharacterized protein n=1 Tax=Ladona fulva TaxID=123851 RepID=A0A8K0P8Q7_LADFU|nr:hypothetical protein J437_LFUL012727 [Ladona fulva]
MSKCLILILDWLNQNGIFFTNLYSDGGLFSISVSDVQGGAIPTTEQSSKSIAGVPFNRLGWNAHMSGESKEKQEQIQRAVSSRMELNLRLEQDDMEGVEENEWDE